MRPSIVPEEALETVDTCICCGSVATSAVMRPNISCCASCGVLFRTPRPSQAWIRAHYDEGSTYQSWEREEPERRRMWGRRLARLQQHRRSGRLLDVGAGDGLFLAMASEAGFDAVGTELSAEGARRGCARGLRIHVGQLEDIDLSPYVPFDVVTAWHVMEHVPWPGRTLDRIHDLLRPGGMFLMAVPNEDNRLLRWRLRGRQPVFPLGDGTYGRQAEIHLTHFQPGTVRRFFEGHGFRVLAFGVDDVYTRITPRNRAVMGFHRILSAVLGWHFGIAMVVVGDRAE